MRNREAKPISEMKDSLGNPGPKAALVTAAGNGDAPDQMGRDFRFTFASVAPAGD
jgi:hypothetical protein